MGRERRKDKANQNSNTYGQKKAASQRNTGQLHYLCDNGRKAGAVKSYINIAAYRSFVISGIQKNAGQDRPDIDQILAEQGEAKHQKAGSNGMAGHVHVQEIDDGNAHESQKSGINKGGADTAYHQIVGN